MNRYYKHTYTFTVLSDKTPPLSLLALSEGECLHSSVHDVQEVGGKEMAKLLNDGVANDVADKLIVNPN